MCRFCWMCRHICPVAGATGSEAWGPRARGLMVSMIERGTEYDPEIADVMYHCTMCDACANDCVTGWRPTDFTREARMHAVVNGIAPAAVMTQIDNILQKGNILGEDPDAELLKLLEQLPPKADCLLYLGQIGRTRGASTAKAFIRVLKKAELSFTALQDERPSGAFLTDLMGYTGEVQSAARAAAKDIEQSGAKKLIALSPYDAVMLREKYAEWKLLDGVEVLSAPAFLASLIAEGKIRPRACGISASVQEPVKLTRGLNETAPLISAVEALGVRQLPFFLNGKMSRCIGTPLLDGLDPSVVKRMVEVREDDARRIGSAAIIGCSPDDVSILKKYCAGDMRVFDLFELADAAL